MDQLIQLIPIIVAGALFAFWAWMFWDMSNNKAMPSNTKTFWTIAFVFFNIFTAVYYYVNVYRDRL